MKKVIVTFTDTPTGEDPRKVTVTAETLTVSGDKAVMTPAMCLAAASLEFVEFHSKQDSLEALKEQMPASIPPHLKG